MNRRDGLWYYQPSGGRANVSAVEQNRETGEKRGMAKKNRGRKATEATQVYDVFLSHNSKDKPAVLQLAEALKARSAVIEEQRARGKRDGGKEGA